MADQEILEDHAMLKQGICKVLECLATISSAAAVVNPIFGVAGSLIRVVLHHIDDEDIRTLKREFGSVNRSLDQLSKMNRDTLSLIQKQTLDSQYGMVEENLKYQFKMFMKMVEAQKSQEDRTKAFMKMYSKNRGDQDLHTLYDGVVGTRKIFSQPILKVYLEHSQGDREVMEHLCKRLTYLFLMGLISLMAYTALMEDDEDQIREDWSERMELVEKKMKEALSCCK